MILFVTLKETYTFFYEGIFPVIRGRCNLKRSLRTVIFLPVHNISSLKITLPKTRYTRQLWRTNLIHPLARDVKSTLLTRKRQLTSDSDSNSLIWNRQGHECSQIWKLSGNFKLIQCIKKCRDFLGRDISGTTFFSLIQSNCRSLRNLKS
jgi:hypothetical protein